MAIGKDGRPSEEHIKRARELTSILLPVLREIARRHGYALALHGSVERDIDLIACPWRDGACEAAEMMSDFFAACLAILGYAAWSGGWTEKAAQGKDWTPPPGSLPNPDRKPHGRRGYVILLGGGPYLDVSVMPRIVMLPEVPEVPEVAPKKRARSK